MITDANVGAFLTERHPDFAPLYQSHLDSHGAEPWTRYLLFQTFAREFMVPRLRTGATEERMALFDTVEQLLAHGDTLIDDAVDHEIIAELVYVAYVLKENPVDLAGAGPLATERIVRTRDWQPGKA
ncbi:hypothetical protein [Catenulispora pinisilvae]|uniref:hypothetical protein n=1 Tax=Catenulispora pinisilvae TaxID=2705253 RepID=UPI0018924E6E|nr:hypothetical protein [Catenulispora pinisilvae]